MANRSKIMSRTAGDTNEHVIHVGRCLLHGIRPELTTTGTITIRDAAATGGSNVRHVCAIALPQTGKMFDGVLFEAGLTIQLSAATDLSAIIWEAIA